MGSSHSIYDSLEWSVMLALGIEIFWREIKNKKAGWHIMLKIRVEQHRAIQHSHRLEFGDVASAQSGMRANQGRINTNHRARVAIHKNLAVCPI